MLTQEHAVEIRVLARQGVKVRAIARELGVSRNTVRRYLKDSQAKRYGPRAPRARKLTSFEAYLQARVRAAHPRWIPATVLLREITERGYDGGISQLKAYLSPLKPVQEDPVVRFETAPGEQLQADFTHIRRGHSPLLAFVATLGYSRASFVRFTTREDAVTLASCMAASFEYFGGVPQHVLLDNPKTIVIERDAYGSGEHRYHSELLTLADAYGFRPRLCRPYRAKTKGKVERFNGYLKGSFVVPLAASLKQAGLALDLAAANAHIGPWLERVANRRVHATTQAVPAERLLIERQHLQPLPFFAAAPAPSRAIPQRRLPIPTESLQHPLSVYEALVGVSP